MSNIIGYNGNPNLRPEHFPVSYTEEQLIEYMKCKNDFFYFCENYCMILSNSKFILFKPRPYQVSLAKDVLENKYVVGKWARQSGKSTIIGAIIAWLTIFNSNHTSLIAAHIHPTAIEIMSKVKDIIEHLPWWLQPGTSEWNQLSIKFENGSRVISSATTEKTGRGFSLNFVLLDEYAFVNPNIADTFFTGIEPTLSSVENSKLVIISTPKGMNHFYKICTDAEAGRSEFKYNSIVWNDVPGRDEKWREKTINTVGESKFAQEYDCQFLGSENTLIDAAKMATLGYIEPIEVGMNGFFKVFKAPIKNHNYFISVDTSRGVGIDASALTVIDITKYPLEVVAHYASPTISPVLFPSVINYIGRAYNEATVLVETNDNGMEVVNILHDEYEYENIVGAVVKGRNGQQLTTYGTNSKGLKTSVATKRVGCTTLKDLVVMNKLIINSFDIISELSNFVAKKNSFEADTGQHDDLVITLVNFAWATNQAFFKNYIELGIRDIYADALAGMEEMSMPIGIMDDGEDFQSSPNSMLLW